MLELVPFRGIRRFMVETADDLPWETVGQGDLWLDVETTSFDDSEAALNPWGGHRICGYAFTVGKLDACYYVPVRHRLGRNVPIGAAIELARRLLKHARIWRNANLKFDAHFLEADGVEIPRHIELHDTTVLSKLNDSDRWDHGLKALALDLLDEPDWEWPLAAWITEEKTKDYGRVPADLMALYACADVIANRDLHDHLEAALPSDCRNVWRTEQLLTPVLFDMEKVGLRIDRNTVLTEKAMCMARMLVANETIEAYTGEPFVDSNKELCAIILGQMGLPVLKWNKSDKTGERTGPSFDKETFPQYLGHPKVVTDPELASVLKAINVYRTEGHFMSLYCDAWLSRVDEYGMVHFQYNQVVRTGRMSGHDPNPQQLNKRAKRMILPRPGRGFMSSDAGQVEFRGIAHYTKDPRVLAAYAENPRTDFHDLITAMCEFDDRSAGKTMNFAMAYGAGKRKVTRQMAMNDSLMRDIGAEVEALVSAGTITREQAPAVYARKCKLKAEAAHRTYHGRFPLIKLTADIARDRCADRGWCFNLYGRRRHLGADFARLAWNTMIQSWAMDVMKERMILLSPRYCDWTRELDMHPAANVHDELLNEFPLDTLHDPEVMRQIDEVLVDTSRRRIDKLDWNYGGNMDLRVPIVFDHGVSGENWRAAGVDSDRRKKELQEQGR